MSMLMSALCNVITYSVIFRELVIKSLTHMFTALANKKSPNHTIHLLKALPLIHFIREDSIPNDPELLHLHEVVFDDPYLPFRTIHNTMDHSKHR